MALEDLSKHEKKDGIWKTFVRKWNASLESDLPYKSTRLTPR